MASSKQSHTAIQDKTDLVARETLKIWQIWKSFTTLLACCQSSSVSSLNVDYKIATKSIAHRIAKVLPKLIDDDQTGYVKGCYIGQNLTLINVIMKITELENIPGMAIFVDFKKAFDTVDWNFLLRPWRH